MHINLLASGFLSFFVYVKLKSSTYILFQQCEVQNLLNAHHTIVMIPELVLKYTDIKMSLWALWLGPFYATLIYEANVA